MPEAEPEAELAALAAPVAPSSELLLFLRPLLLLPAVLLSGGDASLACLDLDEEATELRLEADEDEVEAEAEAAADSDDAEAIALRHSSILRRLAGSELLVATS